MLAWASHEGVTAILIGPDHFTIVTDNLAATRAFYVELLGFALGPRPDFPVDGDWYYIGERPVLHVIVVDVMPEPRRGVLDHMAYSARGLNETLDRLNAAAIAYNIIRTPRPFSTWQVFFFDPNGVEVEFDFDPSETLRPDLKPAG